MTISGKKCPRDDLQTLGTLWTSNTIRRCIVCVESVDKHELTVSQTKLLQWQRKCEVAPVLDYALGIQFVWGHGYIDGSFLDISTTWR
jgi:hypothetical protein